MTYEKQRFHEESIQQWLVMKEYFVKEICSYEECERFVCDFKAGNPFSDPMLSNDEQIANNLIKAIEKGENHCVIAIFKNNSMVGLFSFLVLTGERYVEMLVGLSNDETAYTVMFFYLKEHFYDYHADFVFNPNNYLLYNLLKQKGAEFDAEQQKMIYCNAALNIDTERIELLAEPYISSYLEMHNKDLYWTGDKIIEATNKFRTFVAIENGIVVGYLDVTYCFNENEPFDLFVKEDYRRKSYGRKLLAKALEMNAPNKMVVHLEVGNEPAIRLYQSVGFVKAENQNSLTARLRI